MFSHFRTKGGLILFHFCQEKKQTQGYSAGLHVCQVWRELAVLWRRRSRWLAAQCHCSAWPAPNKAKPVGIFKYVSNVFLPHTHPSPFFLPSQLDNFQLNSLAHNHISNSQSIRVIFVSRTVSAEAKHTRTSRWILLEPSLQEMVMLVPLKFPGVSTH